MNKVFLKSENILPSDLPSYFLHLNVFQMIFMYLIENLNYRLNVIFHT